MQKKHHAGQRNGKTSWGLVLGAVVIVLAFIGSIGPQMRQQADYASSPTLESISVDQISGVNNFSQSETETSFANLPNVPMAPPPSPDDMVARAPASATVEGIVSSNEIAGGKDNKSLLAELVDEDGLLEGDYLRSQPIVQGTFSDAPISSDNRRIGGDDTDLGEVIHEEAPRSVENTFRQQNRPQDEFASRDKSKVAQLRERRYQLEQAEGAGAEQGQASPAPAPSGSKRSESGRRDNTVDASEPMPAEPKRRAKLAVNKEKAKAESNSLVAAMPPPAPPKVAFERQSSQKRDAQNAKPALNSTAIAQHFLRQLENLENLKFQAADGYWANTYVPGDPLLRLLETRLRRWDDGFRLSQKVRQNQQPFDSPENAALALYLNADKAAVNGPTRMRVQIGLRGTPRQSGQRPAMNIAVVLDMRKASANRAAIQALLLALQQAKQPGDSFSLIVANQPGGLLLDADQFRFGPLQLTLQNLFSRSATSATKPETLTLEKAVRLAANNVRRDDDPNAVLGSSLVLLVSASQLNTEVAQLEPLAHANAIEGIFLSAVSLARDGNADAIQRLVLAGQGQRRVLLNANEATTLVDRELYAASRAVARAVRLRIRLAPGVKLIDVLGSRRLQAPEAQRVREAEQSIDRRLARTLGIRADRGEDEEGIQIVIPHFYAGDSHAILLDVVAQGSGPIAEATVRYKDLITLGNGVAHAQLSLSDGADVSGPLQRNVLKNRLAQELSNAAARASQQLARGQHQHALAILHQSQALLQGMRQTITGWAEDNELLHDEQLLADYTSLLRRPNTNQQHYLADALRYVAYRKLIPGVEH